MDNMIPHRVRIAIDCEVLVYLPEGTKDVDVMEQVYDSSVMVCGNKSKVISMMPIGVVERPKY